jgi:transposase-like protein
VSTTIVHIPHIYYNDRVDKQRDIIRTYFAKLDLDHDIADIYLTLSTQGPQNISQLSRAAGIERTRIYRLIEQLMDSNLIEIENHGKRATIKAAPIANLRIRINQRQEELRNLQDELQLIEQNLARTSLSDPVTAIQLYHGTQGLRRVYYNQLQAHTEILSIAYRPLELQLNMHDVETYQQQFEDKALQARTLIGEAYVDSWRKVTADESAMRLAVPAANAIYHHLAVSVHRIDHTTAVYDDITVHYHWRDEEIFAVETRNREIADSQRAFFELLWQQSTPETRIR